MTTPAPFSPMLVGIDRAIALVQAQIATLQASPATALKGTQRGIPGDAAVARLDDLEVFAARLHQIREWLLQDDSLRTVVDDHIGQQARQIERRRARRELWLATITTIVGAILGWLLAALKSPGDLFALLTHHL